MNLTTKKSKCELLAEITSMDVLLKGKITEKHTPAGKTNGHKLQRWHQGKNQSIHVPEEKLEFYTQAVENHKCFTRLVDEYVACCEQEVLHPVEDSKKNLMKQ
jgi:hypothetical protein